MHPGKLLVGDLASLAYGPLVPKDGCHVLMFHAVGTRLPDDARHLYSITPSRFEQHVRAIAQRFSARAVDLTTGVREGRGLAITFDDGFRDTLTVAAPLLVAAKLPFTVFITRDFVGREGTYLSRAELRELAALPGVTIGAHGRTHRRMIECSPAELEDEVADTRTWLSDMLSLPITTMAYPHGAVNERVRLCALRAGYTYATTSKFGAHRIGDDAFTVPRVAIWTNDTTRRLVAKARGHWDWMALRG